MFWTGKASDKLGEIGSTVNVVEMVFVLKLSVAACEAVMTEEPAASMVIVVPETVATDVLLLE